MTPYVNRKNAATRRMAEDMLLRGMAVATIDSYTYHVDRFATRFGKLPEDLGPEEIREFQLWMIQVKKCSWSSFNQAVCGLRFLYTTTLPRPWVVTMIPFGNRPKKLPVVLGQDEVHRLIECVTVPKHRAVLLTLDAAGLRLSEATNLKLPDIDSERMQLRIIQAKGHKDRYVPISPRLLRELREYWKIDKPPTFLFPGKTHDVPLSGATIQRTCKMAAAQAHIRKVVTPHTLRHSFATGLLEAGVDLMAISKLLGHSSFTTTMIYLHCRREHLGSTPSPIDWLPARQCPRPHVHLLVPGSGPSLDGKRWIDCQMTKPTCSQPAKHSPIRQVPVRLTGVEFTRRWSLHILPKSFTKTRCFGGYSSASRTAFIALCQQLHPRPAADDDQLPPPAESTEDLPESTPGCPKCQQPMQLVVDTPRPSWRALFYGPDHHAWFES